MARDFKGRAQRAPAKAATPAWVWLLIGYFAGLVSFGLVWMRMSGVKLENETWIGDKPPSVSVTTKPAAQVKEDRPVAPKEQVKQEPTKAAAEQKKEPDDQLQFDFYSLLTNTEVVVTDDELAKASAQTNPQATQQAKPATEPEKPPVPQQTYLIQVASFRNPSDADSLKAKLAFMGMKAVVNKVDNKGVTWHRVSVGPMASSSDVQRIRKQLTDNGYKTLVIGSKN